MNIDKAIHYARTRLENDLPPHLYYHGIEHTRDIVVPAVERLSKDYQLRQLEHGILITAAWYHDLGYTVRYDKNEPIGVQIAMETLPAFGYTESEIQVIGEVIMATQMPHHPKTLLEKIMVDADLDALGMDTFFDTAMALRKELTIWKDIQLDTLGWIVQEMEFLSQHKYFTRAQRHYRSAQKVKNYTHLAKLFMEYRSQHPRTHDEKSHGNQGETIPSHTMSELFE